MSQKPLPKTDIARTDSTQAMQSLFSAYADDEEGGEVEVEDEGEGDEETGPHYSGSEDEGTPQPTSTTPSSSEKRPVIDLDLEEEVKKRKTQHKRTATRLVSYGPDEHDEDLEAEDDSRNEDLELSEEEEEEELKRKEEETLLKEESNSKLVDYDHSMGPQELDTSILKKSQESSEDESDVKLPPEASGTCSKKLQEKITRLYEKMQYRNVDMNGTIQTRKDFRNPSIYEKLIDYCSINEKGTNYPPELFDPSFWGKESFYDALAKAQVEDMEKREREKKDRTKIEFVTGTKKPAEMEQKRRTKWDTQPSMAATMKPPTVTTAALNNPTVVSVTTSASGTKTTVISAVGTLKKNK